MKGMKGKFYGVGVGPGDPELLTLKGQRVLSEVDYIVTPKTKGDGDSTALKIVAPYIKGKTVIEQVLPMTKDKDMLAKAWADGAAEIADYLERGKNVAFITLGDPSLFSTFMYVFRPIRDKGYLWEIVPGISAPAAAAAALGCGLADGDESLAILAATTDINKVEETVVSHDNTVLMKGAGKWRDIAAVLQKHGLTKHTAAAEKCTMKDERIFEQIEEMPEDLSYFLTAIVRKGKR